MWVRRARCKDTSILCKLQIFGAKSVKYGRNNAINQLFAIYTYVLEFSMYIQAVALLYICRDSFGCADILL